MDWPSQQRSKLVVLGVANTMDLPERVLQNKISSRMVRIMIGRGRRGRWEGRWSREEGGRRERKGKVGK
jgi:hypothetical protein